VNNAPPPLDVGQGRNQEQHGTAENGVSETANFCNQAISLRTQEGRVVSVNAMFQQLLSLGHLLQTTSTLYDLHY
jgi:hypothetical protein